MKGPNNVAFRRASFEPWEIVELDKTSRCDRKPPPNILAGTAQGIATAKTSISRDVLTPWQGHYRKYSLRWRVVVFITTGMNRLWITYAYGLIVRLAAKLETPPTVTTTGCTPKATLTGIVKLT